MNQWLQLLRQTKTIAIIRCSDTELAYKMAHAVAAGGINLIEITWNSDRPEHLIARLSSELPQCHIGTGTILNLQQLERSVKAGAQFAFSPYFDSRLLAVALAEYDIPFIPGAFSPTEIVKAWQQGAKSVKVFPIKSLGGAEYIRCLQGPLGQVPLIPTGGITVNNAKIMVEAGAIAVGISHDLFPVQTIAAQDWTAVTLRTKNLLEKLQSTKNKAARLDS